MPGQHITLAAILTLLLGGGFLRWLIEQIQAWAAKRRQAPIDRLKAEAEVDDAIAARYQKQLDAMEALLVDARAAAKECRNDAGQAWEARRGVETLLQQAQAANGALTLENTRLNARVEELSAENGVLGLRITELKEEVELLRSQVSGSQLHTQ